MACTVGMNPSQAISPVADASQSVDGCASRRFLGVHFTDWLVDLESALLRRTIVRSGGSQMLGPFPLVVVEERSRIHVIVACNEAAAAGGARIGMTLSQAETVCPPQQGAEAAAWRACIDKLRLDGAASTARSASSQAGRIVAVSERLAAIQHDRRLAARMLVRMGRCLERWIPVVSVPPEIQPDVQAQSCRVDDGAGRSVPVGEHPPSVDWLAGDFTGCATLFRGMHASEQGLMRRIDACFRRHGLRVRLATASTVGAAIAVARFGSSARASSRRETQPSLHRRLIAVPKGSEERFLAELPVESLRISASAAESLRAVEVETVGQLAALGRSGIAARLSGLQGEEAAVGGSRSTLPARRGSRRSRHVAATSFSVETPSLFDAHHGGGSETRNRSSRVKSAAKQWRAADDVLLRLDQALGAVPEALVPLRIRDPIVIDHVFEAPCSRPDVISHVCSDMVERLMKRLELHREGLSSAAWAFMHADLPADLSTDALPRIHRFDHGGYGSTADACAESVHGPIISRIALGLARSTSRASHAWSLLRTRLEQLPLDHGVERIECRVERSVRLRFRQRRLRGTAEMPAGISDGCDSQHRCAVESRKRSKTAGHSANETQGTAADWADLISSRLGPASIVRPSGLSHSPFSTSERRPRARVSPMPVQRPVAPIHAHRPSAVMTHPESAVLHGGDTSSAIALSIATRTLWHGAHGAETRDRDVAYLEWRGARWQIGAIDGWERSLPPWYVQHQSAGRASESGGGAWNSRVDSRVDFREGSGVDPSGVLSRIALIVRDGWLWILARWPGRLSIPQGLQSGEHRSSFASPTARAERWFSGSAIAIQHGVDIEVLGIWA
jgi:hypothetical protein